MYFQSICLPWSLKLCWRAQYHTPGRRHFRVQIKFIDCNYPAQNWTCKWTLRCGALHTPIREHLLKRKAQYSWPPHQVSLFCKKCIMFAISKAADRNQLVLWGQLYWPFPFSKGSLLPCNALKQVVFFCKNKIKTFITKTEIKISRPVNS